MALLSVVKSTLRDAKNQDFITQRQMDYWGSNKGSGLNLGGGTTCCYCPLGFGGGGGSSYGKACLIFFAFLAMLAAAACALIASAFAAKSTLDSGRQATGLMDATEITESAEDRQAVLKKAVEVRKFMLAERSFSAVGQWGVAVGLAFVITSLILYVHCYFKTRGLVDKPLSDPRIALWGIRGGYALLGSTLLLGVNKAFYDLYSKNKIIEGARDLALWNEEGELRKREEESPEGPVTAEELASVDVDDVLLEGLNTR